MTTPVALALAGAAAVAFFLVERKMTATPAAPPVPQSVPTGGGVNVSGILNRIGQTSGGAIATAAGIPIAGPVVSKAAGNFVSAEYSGFRQAGSGVTQIASGNIVHGVYDVGAGAVKTAIAPVTSTISTVRGFIGL